MILQRFKIFVYIMILKRKPLYDIVAIHSFPVTVLSNRSDYVADTVYSKIISRFLVSFVHSSADKIVTVKGGFHKIFVIYATYHFIHACTRFYFLKRFLCLAIIFLTSVLVGYHNVPGADKFVLNSFPNERFLVAENSGLKIFRNKLRIQQFYSYGKSDVIVGSTHILDRLLIITPLTAKLALDIGVQSNLHLFFMIVGIHRYTGFLGEG